jgi:hypothetical protein
MACSEIRRDAWIALLLAAVLVIKIVVVLFSPNLLPESLYREKYDNAMYMYRFPEGEKVSDVVDPFPADVANKRHVGSVPKSHFCDDSDS